MSLKKALLMLLFVLGGGILLAREIQDAKEQQIEQAREQLPEKLLPTLNPKELKRVSVVAPKGQYAFVHPSDFGKVEAGENADTTWVLAKPPGAAIDPERLKKIFGVFEGLVTKNTLSASEVEEGADYGLEPAEMTLIFTGANSQASVPRAISIGKAHPISRRRYAQKEGDTRIFLIDAEVFDALNVPPEDIRDHHPLRMDLSELERLLLIRPNADIVQFSKDPASGNWSAKTSNANFPVDSKLLQQRLKLFTNVKAAEFIDEGSEAIGIYGLNQPVLSVHFQRANGKPDRVLDIGESPGLNGKQIFFRMQDSPFIYRAKGAFHADFIRPVDSFRDCHLLRGVEKKNVQVLRLAKPEGEEFLIRSADKTWNSLPVAELLAFLLNGEVLNFEPATPENIRLAGLETPEAEVGLEVLSSGESASEGRQTQKIRLLIGKEISGENTAPLPPGPSGKLRPDGKPRWLGVQAEDGILRPAVLGGVQAEEFLRLLEGARKSLAAGRRPGVEQDNSRREDISR